MSERVAVLIVDDEAPARLRLRELLGELEAFECVGEAADGAQALALSQALEPDIVLLDIRMPGIDGLEVARHLLSFESRPAVVFTTAFDDYAVQAFDTQAVGYLLKPVRRERLARSLEHAARVTMAQLGALRASARQHICVQRARGLELIPVADILYFEADQKYVTVRHHGGEALLGEPLKELEQEFAEHFVRIHRSTLVALKYLSALERDEDGGCYVRLKGVDTRLPVSRRHVRAVKRRLLDAA